MGWIKRRWDRKQYPEHWEDLSRAFRASRDYTCEHCGTAQGTVRISKRGRKYPARVAAAHKYPNDTRNPDPDLLCLCERCHFAYDAQFRDLLAEGEHQARLHALALEHYWQEVANGLPEEQEEAMEEPWNAPTTVVAQEIVIPGYEARRSVDGQVWVCGPFFVSEQMAWVDGVMHLDDFLRLSEGVTPLEDELEAEA